MLSFQRSALLTSWSTFLLSCFLIAPTALSGAEKKATAKASKRAKELTLEDLFPDKGHFGPSARSTAFSHDGKHGAYLYRPRAERRHGSDLWILDANSGRTRRITSVSVLSEFQAEARKVKEDRIRKGRKAEEESKDKKKKKKLSDDVLADRVEAGDAKEKDAPRYAGVEAFCWSPVAKEMLFVASGDIYRYDVASGEITRLTKTRDRERSVQYLPDGKGYTTLRGDTLMRVTFGSHTVEQLDPRLASGETMAGYRISPDGTQVVFLASHVGSLPGSKRKVKIARYRERFMSVIEVDRTVSDDPTPPAKAAVYICALRRPFHEAEVLTKVHTHEVSGPRDILSLPEWAPDSSRAVFAVYTQSQRHVEILEASRVRIAPDPSETKKPDEPDAKRDPDAKGDQSIANPVAGDAPREAEKKSKDPEPVPARVVHRFLHNGGPNTPRMIEPHYLADSRQVIYLSEQTGFLHLHVLDPLYASTRQLTRGRFEVYPVAVSKDRAWVAVLSTRDHPVHQHVYRTSTTDGTMTRLSRAEGLYKTVAVSPDGKRALANHVAFGELPELTYLDSVKGSQKPLTDSHAEKAATVTKAVPKFFHYANRHGHDIHGYLFKPDDWTARDKRPLLIYVYGGPLGFKSFGGRMKQVIDGNYSSYGYFFAHYMAKQHGYVTCTIDPRGSSGYGGLFERSNFEQAGKPQVEDLVDGVKYLVETAGVDPKRVGIHGWSFGGFQTQMCLYTEPDVFAVGIAGAGPTEWENYNSWYSTATIGPSRTGHTDLKKFSLLPLAKRLKGRLLLVHGMEDSNVLYQDTVRVYRELLKAGKEALVELFLDPTGGHGLGGDVKAIGRARKFEDFLLRYLGTGKPAPVETTRKRQKV